MNIETHLHTMRLKRAIASLEGLSVGDAFGDQFFGLPDVVESKIELRELPDGLWSYTDDTVMALSIFRMLRSHGEILPVDLAADFAKYYDPSRGYGPSMHRLLAEIADQPSKWQELAKAQFDGQGSHGNGSAMRVAPIGAYFADDITELISQAKLSSITTHTNDEAICGAIAVAVASAIATTISGQSLPSQADFLNDVLTQVPDSQVRARIRKARDLDDQASVRHAVAVLGNGVGMSAQDTVPFCLWSAAKNLGSFEDALWSTVSGFGDRDTTCAIVGGIVACYTNTEGIPAEWRSRREPLSGAAL